MSAKVKGNRNLNDQTVCLKHQPGAGNHTYHLIEPALLERNQINLKEMLSIPRHLENPYIGHSVLRIDRMAVILNQKSNRGSVLEGRVHQVQ